MRGVTVYHVAPADFDTARFVGCVVRGTYRVRGQGNNRRIYDAEGPGCLELFLTAIIVFLAWLFL